MHLHASTCVRLGFTREYVVPNEPYSHFLLVSQARAVRKSSHRLLPEPKTRSTPDFTFLSQAAFPLTFAIFVACNTSQNKEELSLDLLLQKSLLILSRLSTPLQKEYETWGTTSRAMSHSPPTAESGICHDFSGPYLQVYTDSNCESRNLHPSSGRKCLNVDRKVILPTFRTHSGRYEEDKLQKRTTQITWRHVITQQNWVCHEGQTLFFWGFF